MAISTRPGFPSSAIPPRRTFSDLLPQSICIGPLASFSTAAIALQNERKSKLSKGRSKALKEIIRANEVRDNAVIAKGRAGKGRENSREDALVNNRTDRNARVCKKCPTGVDGLQPEKPGKSIVELFILPHQLTPPNPCCSSSNRIKSRNVNRAFPSLQYMQEMCPQIWTSLPLDRPMCRIRERAIFRVIFVLLYDRMRVCCSLGSESDALHLGFQSRGASPLLHQAHAILTRHLKFSGRTVLRDHS
jgi:hypothetical protein